MDESKPNRSIGHLARKTGLALGVAVLSVALAACGGGGDSPTPAVAGPPSGSAGSGLAAGGGSATGGAVAEAGGGATGGSTGTGGASTGGSATGGAGAGGAIPVDAGAAETDGAADSSGDASGARVASAPGSTTLTWTPPTQTEDGTPLKLKGYRIYWGQQEGHYTSSVTLDNPGLTRYVVEQLAPATWYFVATALSDSGESQFSNVIAMQVR